MKKETNISKFDNAVAEEIIDSMSIERRSGRQFKVVFNTAAGRRVRSGLQIPYWWDFLENKIETTWMDNSFFTYELYRVVGYILSQEYGIDGVDLSSPMRSFDSSVPYIVSVVLEKMMEKINSHQHTKELEESTTLIRKILREEEESPVINDRDRKMFTPEQYMKFFKLLDKNPEKIFSEYFSSMGLTEEEVINIIWNYFMEYKERKPHFVTVDFSAGQLSKMFKEDRDYNLEDMVEGFLTKEGDVDRDYGYCAEVDSYIFSDINDENWKDIEKIYRGSEGDESTEVSKKELEIFSIEELQSEIGCPYTTAQDDADSEYLHKDFMDGIEGYLSNFPGKYNWETEHWESEIDLGSIVNSDMFYDELVYEVEENNVWSLENIFTILIDSELSGEYWSIENGLFEEELININTDRHFRYGGAGTMDVSYFNELLSERLYDLLP